MLVKSLVIVGSPPALAWWLLTPPRFALRTIIVESAGEGKVPAAWAERVLQSFEGENLLRLQFAEINRVLGRHPWVQRAAMEKELPDTLRVRIIEKRAVAFWRRDGQLYYVDATGRPIAEVERPDETADSVVIDGGESYQEIGDAVDFLATLSTSPYVWIQGVTELEVLSFESFRVFVKYFDFPLLIDPQTAGAQIRQFDRLVPWLVEQPRRPTTVDLRIPRRIIVRYR